MAETGKKLIHIHPIARTINDINKIFFDLGFAVVDGPELETEYYNFDALNVPKDHPARDMQDTFWIKGKEDHVLRTHTTSVTARAIEQAAKEGRMPCAFISIGKVFRNDQGWRVCGMGFGTKWQLLWRDKKRG